VDDDVTARELARDGAQAEVARLRRRGRRRAMERDRQQREQEQEEERNRAHIVLVGRSSARALELESQ
jgi:hypothetical protein